MSFKFNIALDAMGGENAPFKVVEGLSLFLKDKISFDDISIKLKQLINNKIFLKYRRKKVNNLTQIEKLNEFVRLKTKTLSVISKFK